jgi:DNA-binding beta-propeller fold protein YncE
MSRLHSSVALALLLAACGSQPAPPVSAPGVAASLRPVHVYVANESSDVVTELLWDGATLEPHADVAVGRSLTEIEGPHGLRIAPATGSWFVSLAHGTPFGTLWKFDAATNAVQGAIELGMFPASMDVTANGQLLFIVNFNLHGDPVPSTVSIVHTPTMTEVARPTTCVMPHGSRVNADGTKHYSTCMHSQQLVEIDTRTFQVTKRFSVVPGHEAALALDDLGAVDGHAGHDAPANATVCSPTWASPARGERAGRFVYVPCNRNGEILEIDVVNDRVTRRFATGRAPYNLDVSLDGRLLIATLKQEQAVAIIDLDEGRELARVPTTRRLPHGIALSPDGRFAFISNESAAGTRSTVDVIDLQSLRVVASTEVQQQAGGIDAAYE